MIIPDINLLVHAYHEASPRHEAARGWWTDCMSGEGVVGLPWAVLFGFVRLTTHPRILDPPLRPAAALDRVESWIGRRAARIVEPGPRHLAIVRRLVASVGVAGSLTTDLHLAALAIEHNAELHSNDRDFARFDGLRWHDPLAA